MARTLAIEAEAMDSPSPRKGNGATRAQQAEAGLSALAGANPPDTLPLDLNV